MSPTSAALFADAILALHVGIVGFVVLGTLAILAGGPLGWRWVRNRAFRIAHLALMAFIALQAWLGKVCPNGNRPCAGKPDRTPTPDPSSNTGCRN